MISSTQHTYPVRGWAIRRTLADGTLSASSVPTLSNPLQFPENRCKSIYVGKLDDSRAVPTRSCGRRRISEPALPTPKSSTCHRPECESFVRTCSLPDHKCMSRQMAQG